MVTVTTRDGVGISTKYKDWGDGQPIVFHHSCRRAQMARETASVQMAEGSRQRQMVQERNGRDCRGNVLPRMPSPT